MTGQGIGQILVYAVVLIALGYPLGLYMARVYTTPGARLPLARGRARLLPARPRRRAARAGLEELREDGAGLQRPSSRSSLYAIQRLQGHLFLNPDHLQGVAVAHRAEHDGELRHEHELAVLRRRVHDVVPDADGRAGGAELRLGRRSGWRCSPRSCAASRAARGRARQLLGRPLPLARLHPAAARAGPRA